MPGNHEMAKTPQYGRMVLEDMGSYTAVHGGAFGKRPQKTLKMRRINNMRPNYLSPKDSGGNAMTPVSAIDKLRE